jgi:hypothetical protein
MRHPRVEEDVEEVGDEIHDDHDEGDEEERALGERVVARRHRLNQEPAEAWPAEDGLDDDVGADALYRAIEAGRVEPGVANEALMRLARVLVPINFTREPRFRHDPAYTVPPLPSLAVAAELARIDASRLGFAKTQLLRGQNRFVAALREAERIAAQALHPSSA